MIQDRTLTFDRAARVIALLLLVGCNRAEEHREATEYASVLLESIPFGGIKPVAVQPICLYWLNRSDGSLWRSRLDGSKKELVVDCRAISDGELFSGVRLTPDPPNSGSSLALGSVPFGAGYTIVEPQVFRPIQAFPTRLTIGGERDESIPMPYAFSSKASPWSLTFDFERYKPTDHYHNYLASLTFRASRKGGGTYRFSSHDGRFMGLLNCDAAVLFDPPNVVLWTLVDDRKYELAKGWMPVLWPRDLAKPERFKPVAVFQRGNQKLKWTMQDPADFRRTP